MIVRKAKISDLQDISSIEKSNFFEFYNSDTIKNDIMNKNNLFFVCICDNRLVGYILMSYIFEEGELQRIAVIDEYKKQGVATMLIQHCEKLLKKIGVTIIRLEVSNKNANAIQLYEKLNYKYQGVRKRYYQDLSDGLIYIKKL